MLNYFRAQEMEAEEGRREERYERNLRHGAFYCTDPWHEHPEISTACDQCGMELNLDLLWET